MLKCRKCRMMCKRISIDQIYTYNQILNYRKCIYDELKFNDKRK